MKRENTEPRAEQFLPYGQILQSGRMREELGPAQIRYKKTIFLSHQVKETLPDYTCMKAHGGQKAECHFKANVPTTHEPLLGICLG